MLKAYYPKVQERGMLVPGSHPASTISRAQMEPLERKSLQLANLSGSPNTSQGTQVENASRSALKFPVHVIKTA